MADKIFGIDKGIIKAFALMIVIIGSLTTFFLSEYVSAIMLGSIFYTVNNGTTYTYTDVTNEPFTVYNSTHLTTELSNDNILVGSISIYNSSDYVVVSLSNFTIDYTSGNITTTNPDYNNTAWSTNYTFERQSTSTIPITTGTNTLLGNVENDFVTTFGYVNTGVKFAAALITVVAVILVFSAFLPKKGEQKTMDY